MAIWSYGSNCGWAKGFEISWHGHHCMREMGKTWKIGGDAAFVAINGFFSVLLLFQVHFGLVLRILILIQFPFCLYFSCCWSLFQFSSVHFIPLVCYFSVSLYLYIYFYLFVLPSFVIWLSLVRCSCFVRPFVSSMPFDEILGKRSSSLERIDVRALHLFLCPFRDFWIPFWCVVGDGIFGKYCLLYSINMV